MPDADFRFTELWRLRLAASRLERECRKWSAAECGKALRIFRKQGGLTFHMQVAFPAQGMMCSESRMVGFTVEFWEARPHSL